MACRLIGATFVNNTTEWLSTGLPETKFSEINNKTQQLSVRKYIWKYMQNSQFVQVSMR